MILSSFIWSVADLLRGKYKPHEYGQVILPFTVLRRMDCVLEPTKQAVLKEAAKRVASGDRRQSLSDSRVRQYFLQYVADGPQGHRGRPG